MKREIKFRAWSLKDKRMLTDEFMALPLFASIDVTFNHVADLVVMQRTGLQDINGIDIYEGDIVKTLEFKFNRFHGVVFFGRGSFWVREYLTNADEGIFDDREKETLWSINLGWEVIGNIYEHPHLLEVSHG